MENKEPSFVIEWVPIATVLEHPDNPRYIRIEDFQKLVRSIKKFPRMMEIRPVVVDEKMRALGGNMRLKACNELGWTLLPIIKADDLSPEEMDEFVIKDNISGGKWDWDKVIESRSKEELVEWGMDVPDFGNDNLLGVVNRGDEESAWVGMPEFIIKETSLKIIVHFETEESREEFAKAHELQFRKKESKSWTTTHPYEERDDLKSLRYEPEGTDENLKFESNED